MKKIKVALFAFVLGSLALTSCSSDSSSGPAPTIIGKWNPTTTKIKIGNNAETDNPYTQSVNGCDKDYIQFVEAGSVFNRVLHSKNPDTGACQESAATPTTWIKEDEELTINGGQFEGTYDVTVLSASELRLQEISIDGNNIMTTTTRVYTKAN